MLLDHQNTWDEVSQAKPDMAILPIGTTEQQGDHLPVGTVTLILDVVARRVAESLQGTVYLLPTMPFGTSNSHSGTPGTIALEWHTLMSVTRDLVESLAAQGIRRVAIITGLGGASETTVYPRENPIVKTAVRQLNYDLPAMDVIWVEPFTMAGKDLVEILDSAYEDFHAGELATSLLLYLSPALVKGRGVDCVPQASKTYLEYLPLPKLCPDGVWGRPSLASAEKGRRALEVAVRRVVEYIENSFAQLVTMKQRL